MFRYSAEKRIGLSTSSRRKGIFARVTNVVPNKRYTLAYSRTSKECLIYLDTSRGPQVPEQEVCVVDCNRVVGVGYYLQRYNGTVQLIHVYDDLVDGCLRFKRRMYATIDKFNDNFIPRSVGKNIVIERTSKCCYLLAAPKNMKFFSIHELVDYVHENRKCTKLYLLSGDCSCVPQRYINKGYLKLVSEGDYRVDYLDNTLACRPYDVAVESIELIKHGANAIVLSVDGIPKRLHGNIEYHPEKIKDSTIVLKACPDGIVTLYRGLDEQLVEQGIIKYVRTR